LSSAPKPEDGGPLGLVWTRECLQLATAEMIWNPAFAVARHIADESLLLLRALRR
jgi:hypothetical protein